MPDFDLFDSTPPPPSSSLRSKRYESKDPIPNPSSSQTKSKIPRPVDDFTAPFCLPYVIHFLTIETPHTDTFTVHGPHHKFAALVPAIQIAVAGSPSAIFKLSTLQKKPDFERTGFTTFVIDLERQGYTVLRVVREVNVPVFDTLPAPVYVVTAYGPVFHDMGTGLRTVASGKPKGLAATSRLVGTWTTIDQARTAARQQMNRLVYGQEGVMRIEKGEIGGKGRWVLMGMNSKAVWEVIVSYDDEVLRAAVGNFDEDLREGSRAKFRF